jgi:hypothetical protein
MLYCRSIIQIQVINLISVSEPTAYLRRSTQTETDQNSNISLAMNLIRGQLELIVMVLLVAFSSDLTLWIKLSLHNLLFVRNCLVWPRLLA